MSDLILRYSIANGIILLLIQWYKKNSFRAAKFYLFIYLAYLIVLAEQLWIGYLVYQTTWYAYCEFPVHFVFSPLTYLYVATYLNPQYQPGRKKLFLLFLPAIADVLCFVCFCLYVSLNDFTMQQKAAITNGQTFYLIRTGIISLYSLYLTISILTLIKTYLGNVKKLYADTGKINIRWLQSLSIISIVFWVICFVYFIIELFYKLPRNYYIPLFLLLSLLIVIQGYFVVLKPDMAFEFIIINKEISDNTKAEKELLEKEKSRKDDTLHLQLLFNKLEKYIEEKAYSNSNLSLSVLAKHCNDSTSMITKAIRYGCNDNFYNYVNRTRARKFLELLPHEIYTLDTLMLKCGFNSKATLHKYVKELTGLTPGVAQKKLKNREVTVTDMIRYNKPGQDKK